MSTIIDHATGEIIDAVIDQAVAKLGIPQRRAAGVLPPEPKEFVGPDGEPCDYLYRDDLSALKDDLVARYNEFFHLNGLEVLVLWKATGGKSGGSKVLGKCQKLSGVSRYLSGRTTGETVDFIVWLAADHLMSWNEYGIEAVLYHELAHIGIDFETGKPVIRAHEFAGFLKELERYGQYGSDLKQLDKVIRQLPLPGGDA